MKTLEQILEDKDLHDIHELEAKGGTELDEDDEDELMCQTLELLQELQLRPQPKFIRVQLDALISKYKNVLSWYTMQ